MILTKDNLRLGLLLGFVGPLAGLVIAYFWSFSSLRFPEFLKFFIAENRLITSIGSLSLLVNGILFTIYINTDKDQTAKGIFIVTLFYGVGILVLKLFN